MLEDRTFAIIGAGTMGEVVLAGLRERSGVPAERIVASAPRAERRQALAERYGIHTTADNREAAAAADVVVLAIKPQVFPRVAQELRGALPSHGLVLSVLAGTPLQALCERLGHEAVVRAIPNLPARIGEGMTVWTATQAVTAEQRSLAAELLAALGRQRFVEDERAVDRAAALSGMAPAYCFLVLEALVDAGVHLGFSRPVATELILEGLYGSLLFARQSGEHPAELRGQVTSPGGVSAESLYALEKGGLRTVLADGVWAAYRRILELGRGEEAPRIGVK
jgi:pyrroline-5-carboxylate reductase